MSGSSGATAPRSFQFFSSPALTELACDALVVKLKRIEKEFASCGQSVVVSLSRYIPSESTQKTSLNDDLTVVALAE